MTAARSTISSRSSNSWDVRTAGAAAAPSASGRGVTVTSGGKASATTATAFPEEVK